MSDTFFVVINPVAGGGRCGKLIVSALDRLRSSGIALETAETRGPGHASEIVRQAWARGYRRFIAAGGDGTSYEIVNGLFPQDGSRQRPTLAFLPLGTGNSFLREFSERGAEYAIEALLARRSQPCDVLRMRHAEGVIHYINLLSMGFAADVAALRARRFRGWGELGYQSSIFFSLLRLQRRPFPLRIDNHAEMDRRPCLFLTFNNSKFTGGTMMIAPKAEVNDGLIEYVRWGPIGRVGLIRNLPTLYDGTHIRHPLAERCSAKRIDFYLDAAVDVMVDGEVLSINCKTLDVLPAVIDVVV
ncbi:MAG TPA: diacylglycerol kinase family protein [Terriglobales bacterium]|nr:diacylglycerol kinase family protein [Terriglobales bacterium]